MSNIVTAKPWPSRSSKNRTNPARPGAAHSSSAKDTPSKVSKNKNRSGDHLTPVHVEGTHVKQSGSAIGMGNMKPRDLPSRRKQGDAMSNPIPKSRGSNGKYSK